MSEIVFCDSGVSLEQMGYVQSYDIGYGIYDENGHGSSLIGLVHKINNRIRLKSIKILNKNNEGSLDGVINALRKCMDLDSRIICLALSVDNSVTMNIELEKIVEQIKSKGKIIIAALYNGDTFSIPAGYQQVIGVKAREIWDVQTYFYDEVRSIQCELPIEDFFWKSFNGDYVKMGGNSVACAFFSEHIASVYDNKMYQLSEIQKIVTRQTVEKLGYYRYFDYLSMHSNQDSKIIHIICSAIHDYNIDISDGNILVKFKNLKQLSSYLNELERKGLKINKRTFLRKYDLQNVRTMTNYFLVQNIIDRSDGELND